MLWDEISHVSAKVTYFRLWKRAEGLLYAKVFTVPSACFIVLYPSFHGGQCRVILSVVVVALML